MAHGFTSGAGLPYEAPVNVTWRSISMHVLSIRISSPARISSRATVHMILGPP